MTNLNWTRCFWFIILISTCSGYHVLGLRQTGDHSPVLEAIDAFLSNPISVVSLSLGFTDDSQVLNDMFNKTLPSLYLQGRTPYLTLEPFFQNGNKPDWLLATLDGINDRILTRIGREIIDFSLLSPIYLRFAPTANGKYVPWSSNPHDYIRLWKYVYLLFYDMGMDQNRVIWVFSISCPHEQSLADPRVYWPGDSYVNGWIELTGYNYGGHLNGTTVLPTDDPPWMWPKDIFKECHEAARNISTTVPLSIMTATSTVGATTFEKNEWILKLDEFAQDNDIRLLIWDNVDQSLDFSIFENSLHNLTTGDIQVFHQINDTISVFWTYYAFAEIAASNSTMNTTRFLPLSEQIITTGVCGPGEYPDKARRFCSYCPAGSYSAGFSPIMCDLCPENSYQDNPGSVECKECPNNTVSYPGARSSQYCLCPGGTYGPHGVPPCLECPIATFSKQGFEVCVKCPRNSGTDEGGNENCTCETRGYEWDGFRCSESEARPVKKILWVLLLSLLLTLA